MFLKNERYLFYLLIIIIFFISFKIHSKTNDKAEVLNYLNSMKNFSAHFLQSDDSELSEGKVYVGKERIRAEYFSPAKILIILDEDKAMYYNYDLEEDEFFNPKNTNAWFFYDIFRNPIFFDDALIEIKNSELILEKKGVNEEETTFLIRVLFEKGPLVLRRVEVQINNESLNLSIYNHSYNEVFQKDFFKLINPKFLN